MNDVQPDSRSNPDSSELLHGEGAPTTVRTETTHSSSTAERPSSSSTTAERNHSNSESKPTRTPKQLAAFERMRASRSEKRKLGAQTDSAPSKDKEKSIEEAAAMFMEMRRREKQEKKDMRWEKLLDETVNRRMTEMEDRLIGLFDEPVERYVEKRRKKTASKETPPPEEPSPKMIDPVMEEPVHKLDKEEATKPSKQRYVSKSSPFTASRRR